MLVLLRGGDDRERVHLRAKTPAFGPHRTLLRAARSLAPIYHDDIAAPLEERARERVEQLGTVAPNDDPVT